VAVKLAVTKKLRNLRLSLKAEKMRNSIGAEGGTRTRTEVTLQRILSPLCLPFHHPGIVRCLTHPLGSFSSYHCSRESRPQEAFVFCVLGL
jgi:hypothetical protein